MALILCRECGKEVSTDAKACPHCGAKGPSGEQARQAKKAGIRCLSVIGIFVLIAIAIFGLRNLGSLSNTTGKMSSMSQLEQSANEGNAGAQDQLGDDYNFGEGVQQDYAKAAYWYQKAADHGTPMLKNSLAISVIGAKVYLWTMLKP